jgi:hypothetical protein
MTTMARRARRRNRDVFDRCSMCRSMHSRSGARFAVYDLQTLVGTVEVHDGGIAVAFNSHGKFIGLFGSLKAAFDALPRGLGEPGREAL